MAPARGFSRRHFLGGLAASSIAMPMIVPSSVFGSDDKAAPCERITVGFIGWGKMANDYHLHELLKFGDVQRLHLHRHRRHAAHDRDHLSSDPLAIVKEPLGAKDVHLEKSPGHHRNWLDCIRSRKRPLADV